MQNDYAKIRTFTKGYLTGKGWNMALRAMHFAEEHHTGFRKDGVTPEFEHQISQVLHAKTMLFGGVKEIAEQLLCTIFLHDVMEDYDVSRQQLLEIVDQPTVDAVWCMTKVFNKIKSSPEQYYHNLSENRIASVAKAFDRYHNNSTLVGVFTMGGMEHYHRENEQLIIPMLKQAKKNFPEQEAVYENLKHMIRNQNHVLGLYIEQAKQLNSFKKEK